ncbi:hypothetical protein ACNOYE_00580 [Nannocystaceae bacterium ST9]
MCLSGLLAMLPAGAGAIPPPPELPLAGERTLALLFVTDEVDPASGRRIAAQLDEGLRAALIDAGYRLVDDGRFADAHLEVSIMLIDEIARAYEITVELELAREIEASESPVIVGPLVCNACTEARVVEFVMAEQSRMIAKIDARTAIAAPPPPMPVEEPEPPPTPVKPWPRQRPLAYAGLATAGVGVIATIVGASLWGTDSVDSAASTYRDLRPGGQALTVIGMLATATGGSLLAVDLRRRQRKLGTLSFRASPGYAVAHFQVRF